MIRQLVRFACLLLLASAATGSTAARKTKVFLFAGQSNMEGRSDAGGLSADERQDLMRVGKRIRYAYNRQSLGPLAPVPATEGVKRRFGADTTFGPELFFGLKLAEAWQEAEFLFIKRSIGATSLHGRWNPDWTREKAKVMGEENAEPLYADFIGYVREILAQCEPGSYEFCGILWVQGEADSNVSKYGPEPSRAYGQNLENLINRVRQDTGRPDLPFVLLEVGGGDVVTGMKATAKKLKNVTTVPRSRDPKSPFFYEQYAIGHYNYAGMKRIGTVMAEAFLRDYGQPK
jgi:hypothetical protein